MLHSLLSLFYTIGEYGPLVIFIIVIFTLKNKYMLAITYIIGFVLSEIINFGAKGLIREPRPSENMTKFSAELRLNKYIGFHRYGMPSEHAQSMFFSLVFAYFTNLFSKKTIAFMSVLTAITLAHRVYFNAHTITQIGAGSVLGAMLGYACFYYAKLQLRGSLGKKDEDNAPF